MVQVTNLLNWNLPKSLPRLNSSRYSGIFDVDSASLYLQAFAKSSGCNVKQDLPHILNKFISTLFALFEFFYGATCFVYKKFYSKIYCIREQILIYSSSSWD